VIKNIIINHQNLFRCLNLSLNKQLIVIQIQNVGNNIKKTKISNKNLRDAELNAKKELDNLQKSLVDESSSLTDRDKVNKFLAKNNVAGIAERLIRNDHKARLLLIEASAVAKPIENWLISQNILEIKKPVPQQPDVKSEESGLDVGADVGETPALAIPGDGRRRDATSSGGENAQGSSSVGLTLSANYDGKSNINILKDGKETGYYISGSKVKKKEYFVFDFSANSFSCSSASFSVFIIR